MAKLKGVEAGTGVFKSQKRKNFVRINLKVCPAMCAEQPSAANAIVNQQATSASTVLPGMFKQRQEMARDSNGCACAADFPLQDSAALGASVLCRDQAHRGSSGPSMAGSRLRDALAVTSRSRLAICSAQCDIMAESLDIQTRIQSCYGYGGSIHLARCTLQGSPDNVTCLLQCNSADKC